MKPLVMSLLMAAAMPAFGGTTVDRIQSAGQLRCGIPSAPEDWNKTDLHGPLAGMDLEICKAIGVAVLGSKAAIDVTPYDSETEAEQGLSDGKVDVVIGVTPQATAAWHMNIAFGPAFFYDGQALLVRADAKATTLEDLDGARVCVVEGTDNEKILYPRLAARGVKVVAMSFQEEGEMDDGMAVRHCDVVSAYVSRLAALKRSYPKQLGNDRVLPEMLTLAPIAPAYRRDDAQWALIVDWTIHALVQAEASGVTMSNVQAKMSSEDPVVARLLGTDWVTSRALSLPDRNWAAKVIGVVGNYGEIYDRTVGMGSDLRIPRGINALWNNGGLMHPLPVQ